MAPLFLSAVAICSCWMRALRCSSGSASQLASWACTHEEARHARVHAGVCLCAKMAQVCATPLDVFLIARAGKHIAHASMTCACSHKSSITKPGFIANEALRTT